MTLVSPLLLGASYKDFIYLYVGDDICRTLERIQSYKKPYSTTLVVAPFFEKPKYLLEISNYKLESYFEISNYKPENFFGL